MKTVRVGKHMAKDKGGELIPMLPPTVAIARTLDTSISSSTEITLNAATSMLRIYAIAKDIYLKWGTADVTAANFDEVIPAGQILDLVVPVETESTGALFTAINLIERESSATVIVIEK
jgi:hypothetical protein